MTVWRLLQRTRRSLAGRGSADGCPLFGALVPESRWQLSGARANANCWGGHRVCRGSAATVPPAGLRARPLRNGRRPTGSARALRWRRCSRSRSRLPTGGTSSSTSPVARGCGGTGLPKGPEVAVQIWHRQTRREDPGSPHPQHRLGTRRRRDDDGTEFRYNPFGRYFREVAESTLNSPTSCLNNPDHPTTPNSSLLPAVVNHKQSDNSALSPAGIK